MSTGKLNNHDLVSTSGTVCMHVFRMYRREVFFFCFFYHTLYTTQLAEVHVKPSL